MLVLLETQVPMHQAPSIAPPARDGSRLVSRMTKSDCERTPGGRSASHTWGMLIGAFFGALVLVGPLTAVEAKDIRLIVGTAAGGSSDVTTRELAEGLRAVTGDTVIVENKASANQRVAITEVMRSPPDGRTLFVGTSSAYTVTPTIFGEKTGYDVNKDLTPIARIATFENAIAIGPKVPGKTWADYVTWIKAHPKESSFASPGAGTIAHFFGLLMAERTGLPFLHMPYRGGAPAINDVLGGHLPMVIVGQQDVLEYHRNGKMTIVAVTGLTPAPALPDVPTLRELGLDVVCEVGLDVYGSAGMSPELVDRLNKQIGEAMKTAEFQARLQKFFYRPAFSTPTELQAATEAERKMWEVPIKASGYKGD